MRLVARRPNVTVRGKSAGPAAINNFRLNYMHPQRPQQNGKEEIKVVRSNYPSPKTKMREILRRAKRTTAPAAVVVHLTLTLN